MHASQNRAAIIATIEAEGPSYPMDLVDATGLSLGVVSQATRRLKDDGVVFVDETGRFILRGSIARTDAQDDETQDDDDPAALVLSELRSAEREISDALEGGLPLYRMTLRLRMAVLPSIRRAIEIAAPARRTLDG